MAISCVGSASSAQVAVLADFSFCEWIGTNLQQNTAAIQALFFKIEIGGSNINFAKFFLSKINQL